MDLIVGDIGGTNTRLAEAAWAGDKVQLRRQAVFRSREHAGLESILQEFGGAALGQVPVCLGVAGPVLNNTARITNLPWYLDGEALTQATGAPWVHLLNDLEAAAWGLEALEDDDLIALHPGDPVPHANQSVIAAGTGLGQAGRVWCGDRYRAFASEGSHADFAPASELGHSLWSWLTSKYGEHVSWERVVSGPGIVELHAFLRDAGGRPTPGWLEQAMQEVDPAAAIASAARSGRDPVCEEALDLFIRYFAREAGNHALKLMSLGGVYLTGGIAPKVSSRFAAAGFLEAFFEKGRMRGLMERMPVYLVTNERLALYGAAWCAKWRQTFGAA